MAGEGTDLISTTNANATGNVTTRPSVNDCCCGPNNTVAGPCCGSPTWATRYRFTLAGIEDETCSPCDVLNGEHEVAYIQTCSYHQENLFSWCRASWKWVFAWQGPAGPNRMRLSMSIEGGVAAPSGGFTPVAYEVACPINALGPITLTKVSETGKCSGFQGNVVMEPA